MKKLSTRTLLALTLSLLPLAGLHAQSNSWSGWITDASCGAKGANAGHVACALKCVAKGSPLVFFNSGNQKLYKLDKQDLAKSNLGHPVVIKGTLKGDVIHVTSIEGSAGGDRPTAPPPVR